MIAALLTGLGVGFLVAAEIGPIWLLCARTALRGQVASGIAVGAGAALVDFAYACVGVAGGASLLRLTGLRLALGLLGAAVICLIGIRTFASAFRIRLGAETRDEVARPLAALRTAVVATASNPLTVASWAAVFTAASTARVASGAAATGSLLVGIGLGSFGLFVLLALVMSRIGRRVGERGLRVADAAAGAGLVAFGGLLAFRSLHGR